MDTEQDALDEPVSEPVDEPESVEIEPDLIDAINHASWQNSVPVLRRLKVDNGTGQILTDLKLTLESTPSFARSKTWSIDRILPHGDIEVADRFVELDPEYLAGLNEAERGRFVLRLEDGTGRRLADWHQDVRLLARDEWGGFGSMPSLLAAFVMPNDPVIAGILKDAAGILSRHGHSSALDGYQSEDPRRAYMLGAAIWSAVAAKGLTYAEPPRSFERNGQKIRRPAIIAEQGLATCLDTTLLFAAALEAAGLNAVAVLIEGHSLTGFWIVRKSFANLIETDASEVRKAIAAREFVTFETTSITQTPSATFEAAISRARRATSEQEEDRFVAAIDIAKARSAQILPLASHQRSDPARAEQDTAGELAELPLPPMPDFDVMPAEAAEEKPSTPDGRIDRWQRKLLDLSLRNRLLNFKTTKQTVLFVCSNVSHLEDRLADHARIRVVSLPEQNPHGDRDASLHMQTTGRDIDSEFAAAALQRDELASPLEPKDLDGRLTELYRRAKSDLNEGGSNTLFLAVGFLKWKKSPEDERSYHAPLMLVPIKLERRSASSRFHLLHHEDEVRFNATLLQLLKKDFDLDLPQFEGELPKDDSGIDVPLVLERMRRAVRDIAGFEVTDETALSTFSFAKYLMWKDLVERTDALRNNRVVRHLIDNPDKPFEPGVQTAFPSERDIDVKYHARDIVSPLPADSSQLAAVMAAAEGQDFVLVGPPGTGKSQTITNMIAQCLATGKSVLFVAEKTAALDVVYRRLRQHGLGDYCLELHSNKAERKKFLNQMKASWEAVHAADPHEWIKVNDDLEIRRDELNAYMDALHRRAANGLSAFVALGTTVAGRDAKVPELAWDATVEHDEVAFETLVRLVDEMALTRNAVRPVDALRYVDVPDWSVAWQRDLLRCARELTIATKDLQTHLASFCRAAGLSHADNLDSASIRAIVSFAEQITAARGKNLLVVFERQFVEMRDKIGDLEEAVGRYRSAAGKLSASCDEDAVSRMNVDDLAEAWRRGAATFWPVSFFRKRRVRKELQSYARDGKAKPASDLPQLRVMHASLAAIAESPLRKHAPNWRGVATDIDALKAHFETAAAMRSSILRIGKIDGDIAPVARAVAPALSGDDAGEEIRSNGENLSASMRRFLAGMEAYGQVAGKLPGNPKNPEFLDELSGALDELQANETALQAWTAWCAIRQKGAAWGLMPLVEAVESRSLVPDSLPATFQLAYARWWLPKAIDADPVLREFKSFRHDEALKRFRELDDRARALAAKEVHRHLARDLPKPHEVARRSELGLLRHQMELQRPSRSIREMIGAMPDNFGKLAPCLLMSPLSIAQYLPAEQTQFDVVIFDEASQITTWDAVGSIARGRQAVIVGDPKQLPPTNFFGRADDGGDEDETAVYERDLESILDEAKASGLRELQLNWHYRSRHESLIAFSNWHYYQNRLITFPSPVTKDHAVWLAHQPAGVYDRGKSRTNRVEADAIVRDATARMVEWLKRPEEERPTLGVITFNAQQQSLIENLFDDARRANPDLEWFFSDDRIEPVIVRNIENVQGDERDIMMFSITFGKDHAGKLTMNFGAVNGDGGERRLNVAVTRAREELVVYSSVTADRIDLSRTKALGVNHLKTFLDFAERGAVALPAQQEGSVGGFDSPFEEAVADAFGRKGWTVVPQIGVSGFRIDLGIVHPDKPGEFLAGIECDGATYHRSATARDRDKVREQVLRNLGWEILRIWSPDWWYDRDRVLGELHGRLDALVEASRQKDREKETAALEREAGDREATKEGETADSVQEQGDGGNAPEGVHEILPTEQSADRAEDIFSTTYAEVNRLQGSPSVFADSASGRSEEDRRLFRKAVLSHIATDADAFFEFSYARTIDAMVAAVIEAEAPVRGDVLAQRIARAHGWMRTGKRIRDQVERHLRNLDATDEATGRFLWEKDCIRKTVAFRYPASDDDRRPVSEISLAELQGFVSENEDVLMEEDPALAVARTIGLDRLAAASRERIEEAIESFSRETG